MGLVYKVTLPPVGAPDVKSRVVTYKINGKAETRDLFYTETSFTLPPVKEGSKVEVSFTETDDAGNTSVPSDSIYFTATDTIAPPKPGQLTVELFSEVEDPAEDPEPAPPPAVEPTKVELEAVVAPISGKKVVTE